MDLHPKDFEVTELLARLKKAEAGYPSELLASRRQDYLRRLAEIGLGTGILSGVAAAQVGKNAAPSTLGGIIETALVVAIVVEAGVAAYIYRDQIADLIRSYSTNSSATDVASPVIVTSPLPEVTSAELIEASQTPTPTLTLTPSAVTETIPAVATERNETDMQVTSTPDPKGNNGNHYGQTPKAERTKDKDKDKDKDKNKDKDR